MSGGVGDAVAVRKHALVLRARATYPDAFDAELMYEGCGEGGDRGQHEENRNGKTLV
jgi:hypothetical protein